MRTAPWRSRALAIATGLALVGCNHGPMGADQRAMERLAAEMEQEVARMRPYVAAMRQQSAAQWQHTAAEHARMVREMLNQMDDIMGEMQRTGGGMMGSMGMHMQDARMGELMGMGAAEHHDMLRLMEELRKDAEKLLSASASDVAEWMPPHLDRLETMLQMMERSAEHMRSMPRMHYGS